MIREMQMNVEMVIISNMIGFGSLVFSFWSLTLGLGLLVGFGLIRTSKTKNLKPKTKFRS